MKPTRRVLYASVAVKFLIIYFCHTKKPSGIIFIHYFAGSLVWKRSQRIKINVEITEQRNICTFFLTTAVVVRWHESLILSVRVIFIVGILASRLIKKSAAVKGSEVFFEVAIVEFFLLHSVNKLSLFRVICSFRGFYD